MKTLIACLLFCFSIIAGGCATPNKLHIHDVTFDYDVRVDFSQIRSYNWVKMPGTSRIDLFNQTRIKEVANIEMQAKGLKIEVDKPDVFMVMYGGAYKAFDMNVMMDYAVYDVGRLKLAMYDAVSHSEIWWGESRADLFYEMTPAEKDEVVKQSVQQILALFPPQPNPFPPKPKPEKRPPIQIEAR